MTYWDELERLAKRARVSADRPLELYCAHGRSEFLNEHTVFGGHIDEDWGPCRVTTGPEFDEHELAEYVIAAANAVPALIRAALDVIDAARVLAEQGQADPYGPGAGNFQSLWDALGRWDAIP